MRWDTVALASIMMVDTLSSRISFNKGVGSLVSSNMRTDRVSFDIRNWRTSSSSRSKPEERNNDKAIDSTGSGRMLLERRYCEKGTPLNYTRSVNFTHR